MDKTISFQAETQRFRTPISSAVQNKQSEEILFDLLNLSNRNNRIESSIEEMRTLMFIENHYRDIEMNVLLNKNKSLQAQLETGNLKVMTLTVDDMYLDGSKSSTANVDRVNNCITLPFSSSVSKLVLMDPVSGETFVPDGLKARTILSQQPGIISEESVSPLNALRRDHGVWYSKVVTEKGVNSISMDFVIDMPDSIIDSRDVNTIIINTFPFKGVDIEGIHYKLNGDWIEVPGISSHSDVTKVTYGTVTRNIFKECGNIMLSFKDVSAKSIKISFKQSKFIEENEKNSFYLGCKSIEVLSRRYEQMSGSVFIMANTGKQQPIVVHDIVSIINNRTELTENPIQYELFSLDENDMPSRVGSLPLSIENGKMLIKCNIYKNSISPNISQIQVKYSV